MITVTEEARALIGAQDTPEGTVLRLDPVESNPATEEITIRFAPGVAAEDDQVVEHEGEEVLRIAAPVSEQLSGSTLDVVLQESENGSDGPRMGLGIRVPDPETR